MMISTVPTQLTKDALNNGGIKHLTPYLWKLKEKLWKMHMYMKMIPQLEKQI